jgi:hypothetical protein
MKICHFNLLLQFTVICLCLKNKEIYCSIYPHVKSIFTEVYSTNSNLILSMREEELETEPSTIKIWGYNYSIYTFYLKSLFSDLLYSIEFLYNKFHHSVYSNRFQSFLKCNKYKLTRNTPISFIKKYATFFDDYLSKYLNSEFKNIQSKEELNNVISELIISENVKCLLQEQISWNNLMEVIDSIFIKKLKFIDQIIKNEESDHTN